MIGENSGTGTGYLTGKFWGKFPGFPQKLGWGRGRHFWGISGTNWGWGQTRDWGIFGENPRNSPKIGVGTGKTFLGNIGDNLGTGTKFINSPNFPKIPIIIITALIARLV